MACSRIPKCSVRPYGPPFQCAVSTPAGRNDGSPAMVVLLDSARSAEPPQSSGSTGASALSTSPEALRVATPLASAGNTGNASANPSGRTPACSRSNSAARSGLAVRQASNPTVHSARAAWPRSTASRVCASTLSSTWNDSSGSSPSSTLVAATSSAPSADPCALPVFRRLGAGQPMIVRRAMNEGREVSARAASTATARAATSTLPSGLTSTYCVCQP